VQHQGRLGVRQCWRRAHLLAEGAIAAAISKAVRPLPGDVARDASPRSSCKFLQERSSQHIHRCYISKRSSVHDRSSCKLPTALMGRAVG
jgi:hypothetical protein